MRCLYTIQFVVAVLLLAQHDLWAARLPQGPELLPQKAGWKPAVASLKSAWSCAVPPLANAINRAPEDELRSEAIYEVHVMTQPTL